MKNVNKNLAMMNQILKGIASKMSPASDLINQESKLNDPTEELPNDKYNHLLQQNVVITNKLKTLQEQQVESKNTI